MDLFSSKRVDVVVVDDILLFDILLFSICQSLSTFLLAHKRFSSSKQYRRVILLSAKLYSFHAFFLFNSSWQFSL